MTLSTVKNFTNNLTLDNEFISKIDLVIEKVDYLLSNHISQETIINAQEVADNLFETLKVDITYTGTDEEKEKQQGRALFERQKMFSFLLKTLTSIGLSSRRGLQVESESLTVTSMSMINLDLFTENEVMFIKWFKLILTLKIHIKI